MDKKILLGKPTEYKSHYDNSLLFPINRQERRKNYVHMFGEDIWTCYEFSYLLLNSLPQYHVIRISNPVNSVNIFESKSLKLYLNSFNNTRFNNLEEAIKTIESDLTNLTTSIIKVEVIKEFSNDWMSENSYLLDDMFKLDIKTHDYDKSILEVINRKNSASYVSNLLRSNCEITNQPDWARIYISYEADKMVTPESLLRYIISYRNHQEFHEPTCERIFQDLYQLLEPLYLTVICQYTRRGGIDINPIRSTHPIKVKLPKLIQQ